MNSLAKGMSDMEMIDPDARRRLKSVATTLETCGKHGIPIDFAMLASDIRAALSAYNPDERRCLTCGAQDPRHNEFCSDGFHAPGETYWPDERLREAAWQPMPQVPKHGRRIYVLHRGGQASIIYANPELDRSPYLAWWPLPEHHLEAVSALSPLPQGDDT